jgi:SET domain-containing protein
MRTRSRFTARIDPHNTRFLLLVGRSPVDRYGVFAGEDIPPNRRVIEYTGERISYRAANRRFAKILRSNRRRRFYFFILSRRWVIDGSVGGSGAELINHSCDPNLVRRRIRGHIYYYTRKRIRAGEELNIDYRFAKDTLRCKCRCGSPKCRGTINLR